MTPEGWNSYKLGEVVEITSSKRIYLSDYVNEGVPFYRSKEIIERFNKQSVTTELFIAQDKYNDIEKKFGAPKEGDLLLTSVGTLGIPLLVTKTDKFYFKDGNLTWFRNYNADRICPKYLYFWFQSTIGKRAIQQSKIGSTQQAITIIALKNIQLTIPSISEQFRIASILSSLDDKIELNLQMNKTLEVMAQAIFKEWFVDFRFPGFDGFLVDGLPRGWRKCPLSEAVTVKGGSTPSTLNPEYWNGESNWATPKDLSYLKSPVLLNTERRITDSGVKQISSGILPVGTLLLSSRAPIGYLAINQIPVSINQGFIAIQGKLVSNIFMLFWVRKNMDLVKGRANGSTFQEISKSSFKEIGITIPHIELLNSFDTIIDPIIERIVSNEIENQNLIQIRDTLLPKLMTGKIIVQ